MPEQAFSASYDSTTKAISAVVCAMLIAVAWMVHIIFVALLFPLLICLAYAYSTREYALSGGAIVVKRAAGGHPRDPAGNSGRFHGLREAVGQRRPFRLLWLVPDRKTREMLLVRDESE
jgi:hypothetical protein